MIMRGDIFYADLGNVVGSEQGGIRPVLIVQNDKANQYSPTFVILPITSAKKRKMPVHIRIPQSNGLPKESIVLAEQIRTIDHSRLLEYIGSLDEQCMKNVDDAIKISLGVNNDETVRTS